MKATTLKTEIQLSKKRAAFLSSSIEAARSSVNMLDLKQKPHVKKLEQTNSDLLKMKAELAEAKMKIANLERELRSGNHFSESDALMASVLKKPIITARHYSEADKFMDNFRTKLKGGKNAVHVN